MLSIPHVEEQARLKLTIRSPGQGTTLPYDLFAYVNYSACRRTGPAQVYHKKPRTRHDASVGPVWHPTCTRSARARPADVSTK
eukprot:7288542-Pyramimonas_sp.AAC.1